MIHSKTFILKEIMKKNLNEHSKEVIEENFLSEEQNMLPNQKVHVYKEMPKTEKVVFMNNRDPGIPLYFHYASKTHPLHHYELYHGETYELPVEVINHLEGVNKHDPWSCHKRTYGQRMKPNGIHETFVNGYVPYFQLKHVRAA